MSDILVKVTNRDNGVVGYQIPDMNINRNFAPKETKQVPLSELKALQFVPGGEFTLRNLLIVNDMDALSALNMADVEPEYHYTEDDVRTLLHQGSLDQLEDALNFAPEGVINLIKDIAVKEEVADVRKRDLIYKKTGFNVNNAINVSRLGIYRNKRVLLLSIRSCAEGTKKIQRIFCGLKTRRQLLPKGFELPHFLIF